MLIKLGPAVVWGLYLAICYTAAPEILPFIFWCIVVGLAIWVGWLGVLSERQPPMPLLPPPPSHHSTLTGGQCFGVPKKMETRSFKKDGADMLEITKQCPACRMMFFEKRPK